MSRAKENETPPKMGACRIGAKKHEAVVERETRARVRVSFPNARISRFSLASPEKREKKPPVLQAKNHPRRHRGKSEGKGKSKRAEKMPFSTFLRDIFSARLDFPLHSLSAPGSPRMAKNGGHGAARTRNPN